MSVQVASAVNPASAVGIGHSAAKPASDVGGTRSSAALPADGKASPPPAPATAPQVELEHSRAELERFVRSIRRELEFTVDDASGRTIITVRNKDTGEVVRQIPAEEVIALARAVAEGRPMLLESEA
jgi:flagellar protein FlaG